MKQFSGFEAKKAAGAREIIPAGGYVAKVLDAQEVTYDWGSILLISFDIADGQYKDFFAKDYKEQDREDKKWRGTYRLRIPKDDGSEQDGWSKRAFNNAIFCFEDGNPGYHWNWDEGTLKGKTVGVLFRNREWEMNGNTGWTTECCALACVGDIRGGNFKMPKDKPLKDKPAVQQGFSDLSSDSGDYELPF